MKGNSKLANYDFSHFSSYEFEILVRDLLQRHMNVYLESFKNGKDRGIDLRHSSPAGSTTVIQCKRYVESKISDLYKEVAKEAQKLTVLQPSNYLLCTSLGLLPQHKEKLLQILNPFCKQSSDIYGREDLNNLLTSYPDLEAKHHKLWLHSFEVLKNSFHSSVLNFTNAELERIENKRNKYVSTSAFNDAHKILEGNHYCVITGIPGIGKTTLAEMLILAYAGLGFEIIKISKDISEAFALHNKEKRQLFYYDDFLGQTGLQNKLEKNEDDRLTGFVALVKSSKNSRFLMTSREYILKQAQADYEKLAKLDFKRCVLEPPQYTNFQRALILYNHLYFSQIAETYKKEILSEKTYLKIIKHHGYNPRLISYMTESAAVDSINEKDYCKRFISLLDNPEEIWSHAFKKQISESAKCLLTVLTTMPSVVLLSKLKTAAHFAYYSIAKKYGLRTTTDDLENAIAEIEDTFIRLDAGSNSKTLTVEFHSPSVRDFLENYLASHNFVVQDLIEFATFYDQLRYLCAPMARQTSRQLIKNNALDYPNIATRLMDCFFSESLEPTFRHSSDGFLATDKNTPWTIESRLLLLINISRVHLLPELTSFIKDRFEEIRTSIAQGVGSKSDLIELYLALEEEEFICYFGDELEQFREQFFDFMCSDLWSVADFKMTYEFAEQVEEWKSTSTSQLREKFISFFREEKDNLLEEDDFEDTMTYLEQIDAFLDSPLAKQLETLMEAYRERKNNDDDEPTKSWDYTDYEPPENPDAEIDAMFEGLR